MATDNPFENIQEAAPEDNPFMSVGESKEENPFLEVAQAVEDATVPVQQQGQDLRAAAQAVKKEQDNASFWSWAHSPVGRFYAQSAASFGEHVLTPIAETITQEPIIRDTVSGIKDAVGNAAKIFEKHSGAVTMSPDDLSITTTPAQVLTSMGARTAPMLNTYSLLEKFGVPTEFYVGEMAYLPQTRALIQASGGDPDTIRMRLALSLGMDWALQKGFTSLLKGLEAPKVLETVDKLTSMPEEAQQAVLRESLRTRTLSEEGSAIVKSELTRAELTANAKTIKTTTLPGEPTSSYKVEVPHEAVMGFTKTSTLPTEIIANGLKYDISTGKAIPLKPANSYEKLNQLLENADIVENPSSIIKEGETLHNVLTEAPTIKDPGVPWAARGWRAMFRSPEYYAPTLYSHMASAQREAAALKTTLSNMLGDWSKIPEQERFLLGAQADGILSQADFTKAITEGAISEQGLQLLNNWRKVAAQGADLTGLEKGRELSSYLHHVIEQEKKKDWWDGLNNLKDMEHNIKKGALRERTGATGYTLDIGKSAEQYIEWAARHTAEKKYLPLMEEEVSRIKALDPTRGHVAENLTQYYFGILKQRVAAYKVAVPISNTVKSLFGQGALSYNLASGILNSTQGPVFGTTLIGYRAYNQGVKLATEAIYGSAERKGYLKNLLRESGILEDMSNNVLDNMQTMWSKVLPKAVLDHQYDFMKYSEYLNKATVYLGAHQDIMSKMDVLNKAGLGKLPAVEKYLTSRGVDLLGNVEDEAWKYARKVTAKTQIDMSRAGATFFQTNPFTSPLMMFMNYPTKISEYVLSTAGTVTKLLADPKQWGTAIHQPEVQAAMRMAINAAGLYGIGHALGASPKKIMNFLPSFAPIMQTAMRGLDALEAMQNYDPAAAEKMTRVLCTLSGLPVNAPIWKIKLMVKTAIQNKDVQGDEWTIYDPRNPRKPLYTVNKWLWSFGKFTNLFDTETEDQYHELFSQKAKEEKQISNLNKALVASRGDEDKRLALRSRVKELSMKRRTTTKELRDLQHGR